MLGENAYPAFLLRVEGDVCWTNMSLSVTAEQFACSGPRNTSAQNLWKNHKFLYFGFCTCKINETQHET